MHWVYLAIAIVSEVIATSALKVAEGFTRFSYRFPNFNNHTPGSLSSITNHCPSRRTRL
jgi:hypothetical protein